MAQLQKYLLYKARDNSGRYRWFKWRVSSELRARKMLQKMGVTYGYLQTGDQQKTGKVIYPLS